MAFMIQTRPTYFLLLVLEMPKSGNLQQRMKQTCTFFPLQVPNFFP